MESLCPCVRWAAVLAPRVSIMNKPGWNMLDNSLNFLILHMEGSRWIMGFVDWYGYFPTFTDVHKRIFILHHFCGLQIVSYQKRFQNQQRIWQLLFFVLAWSSVALAWISGAAKSLYLLWNIRVFLFISSWSSLVPSHLAQTCTNFFPELHTIVCFRKTLIKLYVLAKLNYFLLSFCTVYLIRLPPFCRLVDYSVDDIFVDKDFHWSTKCMYFLH